MENFNLSIKAEQTIAIVGPSGSGKSTAIQLLQRNYDVLLGTVFVDGVDIRDIDLLWFRSLLGVVQQEPTLFSGTVEENIRLGKLDATTEEIQEAAKQANAHEFILKLPDGYKSWIGEGGAGMSGGQKQRIAIARALVRQPRILLLDEATSALDTRSEKAVQAALDAARAGRTVITVAHRLTTVRDADRIVVIREGEIAEEGTHDELVALKGIYAGMLNRQVR
ncbi:unnamed protein product [Protopolystoma xenopodis]|uniref:ABC transporter domain-containing protein n=1 Tax=Protopolystoma xenopodis TaxID=117903 RepID=A0A448WAF9_9PLAT|nr:unnamed protein product [Protopolystoma xenopodis]